MTRITTLIIVIVLLLAAGAHAAAVRIAVPEFKVSGAANRDDLKGTLHELLAARLAADGIDVVGANASADATVSGSYVAFGKVFSLDVRVADASGKVYGRAFEQGESADEVIPAINRLAGKLAKVIAGAAIPPAPQSAASAPALPPSPSVPAVAAADVVRPAAAPPVKTDSDLIRAEAPVGKAAASGMIGQRLAGVIIGIAPGRRDSKGEREVVAALRQELRLYTVGKEVRLLQSLKEFTDTEKIVAVDTADLDGDGTFEVYVTALNGEQLASRVYLLENGSLRRIAGSLPYFFRAMPAAGGVKKVYAQQLATTEDFYGDLYEVVKTGDKFTLANPQKLPRFGNIFTAVFMDIKDGRHCLVLHPDGYLLVYNAKGEEIWRSSDGYGGSDIYFNRDNSQNQIRSGEAVRKVYIDQRISITKNGDIILPKNDGYRSFRDFNKNSVYAFTWNGAALDELWHTKLSQHYLSDYIYDEDAKELLLAEVVKKEGVKDPGATAFSIRKVE